MTNGTATLRFIDANGNGLLDVGDYFAVSCVASSTHRFEFSRWTWTVVSGSSHGPGC